EKTEEPTQKKLADARKKGFVAKSQDLTISIMLLLSMILLSFISGYMFDKLAWLCKGILQHLNIEIVGIPFVTGWVRWGIVQIVWIIFPLFACVVILALLCNLLQTGFIFSSYPLIPKWYKLNLFHHANYVNNFSYHALIRLSFGIVRVLL